MVLEASVSAAKFNDRLRSESSRGSESRRQASAITFTTLLLSLLSPTLASTRSYGSAPITPICPPHASSDTSAETQLQQVADSFESILEATGPSYENNIPVDPLLDACRTLSKVLQQTGPKAVARDFDNNIKKIEAVLHQTNVRTVSSLLQLERDSGVHRVGSSTLYLHEQSGAMGLLWVRRTLAFQSDFYERLLDGFDPTDAIHHAYQQQLKPYHGWALTKCYNMLVGNNMPPRRLLLARVGGYHEQENHSRFHLYEEKTLHDLKRLVASWKPLIQHWKYCFTELGMEDTRRV